MKPDSMLVESGHIISAQQEVADRGIGDVAAEFGETEPALASFVFSTLTSSAGKLALSGAPTQVVQGVHEDTLTLVLTCLRALRRAHYELWQDLMDGATSDQPESHREPAREASRRE